MLVASSGNHARKPAEAARATARARDGSKETAIEKSGMATEIVSHPSSTRVGSIPVDAGDHRDRLNPT